jgi:hypothetical protein
LKESAFAEVFEGEHAYLLGMAYLMGIGVERDFDRAVRLLEVSTGECSIAGIKATIKIAEI